MLFAISWLNKPALHHKRSVLLCCSRWRSSSTEYSLLIVLTSSGWSEFIYLQVNLKWHVLTTSIKIKHWIFGDKLRILFAIRTFSGKQKVIVLIKLRFTIRQKKKKGYLKFSFLWIASFYAEKVFKCQGFVCEYICLLVTRTFLEGGKVDPKKCLPLPAYVVNSAGVGVQNKQNQGHQRLAAFSVSFKHCLLKKSQENRMAGCPACSESLHSTLVSAPIHMKAISRQQPLLKSCPPCQAPFAPQQECGRVCVSLLGFFFATGEASMLLVPAATEPECQLLLWCQVALPALSACMSARLRSPHWGCCCPTSCWGNEKPFWQLSWLARSFGLLLIFCFCFNHSVHHHTQVYVFHNWNLQMSCGKESNRK